MDGHVKFKFRKATAFVIYSKIFFLSIVILDVKNTLVLVKLTKQLLY